MSISPPLMAAIGFAAGGVFSLLRVVFYFRKVLYGRTTTGHVCQRHVVRRGGPNQSNSPRVSVTVAYEIDGEEYELCTGSSSGAMPSYSVGQEVTIKYFPRSPSRGVMWNGIELFKWCVLFFGSFAMFGIAWLLVMIHFQQVS